MTTLADLERVERELRDDASPHLGDGWSLHRKRQADTIAAFVREQRERELPDTDLGPWRADGKFIYSANFDHDAMLTVSGDFNSESVRDDFAAKIADRLNAPPTDTIAAYIAAQGWQPIETAPRDGTAVLLASSAGAWFGTWKPVYQSGYMPLNPWFSLMLNHDHLHRPSGLPTHWMPLPEPPKENSDG